MQRDLKTTERLFRVGSSYPQRCARKKTSFFLKIDSPWISKKFRISFQQNLHHTRTRSLCRDAEEPSPSKLQTPTVKPSSAVHAAVLRRSDLRPFQTGRWSLPHVWAERVWEFLLNSIVRNIHDAPYLLFPLTCFMDDSPRALFFCFWICRHVQLIIWLLSGICWKFKISFRQSTIPNTLDAIVSGCRLTSRQSDGENYTMPTTAGCKMLHGSSFVQNLFLSKFFPGCTDFKSLQLKPQKCTATGRTLKAVQIKLEFSGFALKTHDHMFFPDLKKTGNLCCNKNSLAVNQMRRGSQSGSSDQHRSSGTLRL